MTIDEQARNVLDGLADRPPLRALRTSPGIAAAAISASCRFALSRACASDKIVASPMRWLISLPLTRVNSANDLRPVGYTISRKPGTMPSLRP